MKAKQYSFKRYPIRLAFLLILILFGFTAVNAQCPTVTNSSQSLCDVQSVLVGDLQAIDNGGGVVWYDSPTSTVPLLNSDSLISGQDYYADDNSGTCGARARVDITIYGPPVGDNFQGVCLDDPSLATVSSLVAIGNDVQWYLSPSGGTPLNDTDILIDNTIYYADQASPDGSCRTSRLSVLVLVGATPIPTGDMIQNFCVTPEFTPTVGDLVASGNNNWYISLFSALELPPSTPLESGQTYYATTLDPPCESTGRLSVLAILDIAPNAGEDSTLDLCDNSNSTIDLFLELGGTPDSGGTWTPSLNSGTGIFDPNIDAEGIYTYTVSSNNSCPDDSAIVTVTLIPEPNAGTDGTLDLCSNSDTTDLFLSLGGTPETGGIWSPALASGTGEFNPALDSDGIYTYTVSGTLPCTDVSATVTVSVTPFKDAGEDGSIDICDTSGTIDLFDSLGGIPDIGGVWSPALNSGTGIFNPTIDSPGAYTYEFIGNTPCPDESATVTVTINPLPNAGSDGVLEICSNDFTTVDLFDSLGDAAETGGTWSPTLTSGSGIFDPSIDTAGIYTYTVTGISPCPDASADINVIIIPEPDAGLNATIDICSNNGTFDLYDYLGGNPEIGGTWSPALASGTSIYDPLIDTGDTFTYTVAGTTPCADASATITITVTPFLDAGLDGAVTICTNDGTIDLFDSLGGIPDTGGTWSPPLASGTGMFDPNIDTGGTYTYTTSGSEPCLDDSSIVVVTVEQSPDAGSDGTLLICSFSNTVDLFDSLNGIPQSGGTWSPALSSGTGVFNPNLDADGIYTYTINSICGDVSAAVSVTSIDANYAGTNGSVEFCSTDTTTIDLFDRLGDLPDTGGTWSPALSSGTGIFDPTLDAANTYTYTVLNSATLCPDDSATVIVSILEEPNAGNDGTLNLCNSTNTINLLEGLAGAPEAGGTWSPTLNSGTGIFDPSTDAEGIYTYTLTNSCGTSSATVDVSFSDTNDAGTDGSIDLCSSDATVDLFNSLGGTPDIGGTWSPALTSGTGEFDPSLDAAGTYTYTISSVTPACPDATATVEVTVLQGPNAGNDGTLNLCDSNNTVNLLDGLAGNPESGGTWSPTPNSGTGILDPNTDPEGIYTYTISNSCGASSATVAVSFSDTNDAGTDGSIDLCSSDAIVDLFNSLGGIPDVGGTWSPALASGSGVFNPSIDAAGSYTYTITSVTPACPDATAIVEVTVLQGPNAGNDGTLNLCDSTNAVDLFDSLAGAPDTGGTWTPVLDSGSGIFNPNIDPEDSYTYTVSNSCGTSSATVAVSFSDTNDAGTDGSIDLCSSDATVDLFNSLGGTPDVGGTWSPALTSGTGEFDPSLDAAGTYTYTMSSVSAACPDATATVEVSILQTPDAGNVGTLDICSNDSSLIDLIDSLSGSPDAGGTWSPALASGTGMFDLTLDTAGAYTYTVSNTCGTSSAIVTVTISTANDAGTDGAIEFCSNASTANLFDSLGGTPQTGGTWSPALTSGTGEFDPSVDAAGDYTYTVSDSTSSCPESTATITVTILPEPNAGTDNTLNLCIDQTDSVNLFDSLGGLPEIGGTWTPALASGTGYFDPTIDTAGIYTYSVTSTECGITNSANVDVTIIDLPDLTGLTMSIVDNVICVGLEDAIIDITGANQLPDGDYSIVYSLTEANNSVNTIAITIIGGNASFTIPQVLLPNSGLTFVTLTQLFVLGQNCSAITSSVEPIKILVEELPAPEIIDNGTEFCLEDSPTITDLSNNIVNEGIVIWYDAPIDGIAYDETEALQEGTVYYGSLISEYGCESNIRLEVTISFIPCIGELLIPDGFSPNDDGINDVFDILWLNDLYPNFKLSVYNRYGNILYEGDINSPKWDGTSKKNSTELPAGVYFYVLEFNDGEREAQQGRVYLNR
ncbi:T9SS type B sorting domain-containing protein [Winogradskyella thalassocola]|uniref:Gliding motility-associated C-terminal domain-containing protein n=1 Tax=Winogradskyella thalassocola TaxID=262004 RepID=A0A1G8GSK9_9FLAO|nr:gliding motility-associated C-terminal domain-containing protein [Winogradskyella thalassocola]SDH97408.1 gliding motility-associated C-terminal domain-containing protein [Winogradskyella thalassocola]